MDLGTRLKKLRTQKGLSLRKLAQIAGCSHQSIAFFERNENLEKIKILQRLGDYFDVSMDYLINGTVSEDSYKITEEELQFLSKYRNASDYYKSIVNHVLDIK